MENLRVITWKDKLKEVERNCDPKTVEGFVLLCQLFTDELWESFVNDLIYNPFLINDKLFIIRNVRATDKEIVVNIVTYLKVLSRISLNKLAKAIDNVLLNNFTDNKQTPLDSEVLDDIFYLIFTVPIEIKSSTLKIIALNSKTPLDNRFEAARLLYSKEEKLEKEFWVRLAEINPKSRLTPLSIAALSKQNIDWAWELIEKIQLDEIPQEIYFNYLTSFRTFIRELKIREEKKIKILFPQYKLPNWSRACFDLLLKEREFDTFDVYSEPPSSINSNLKRLKVGISPFLETTIFELGVEKGFFEEQGLEIQIKHFGWDKIFSALDSGEVDIIIGNKKLCQLRNKKYQEKNSLNKYDNSKDLFIYKGFSILVKKDSPILTYDQIVSEEIHSERSNIANFLTVKTLQQLKDKVIIASRSTDHLLSLLLCTRKAELEEYEDFNIIENYNPDEGLQKFISGVGHAYVGGIPQKIIATRKNWAKELINYEQTGIKQLIQSNVFISLVDSPNINSDTLEKLEEGWFNYVRGINDNYVAENYKIIDEVLDKFNSSLNNTSNEQIAQNQLRNDKYSIYYKFDRKDFNSFWQKLGVFPIPKINDDLFEALLTEMQEAEAQDYENLFKDNKKVVDITTKISDSEQTATVKVIPDEPNFR